MLMLLVNEMNFVNDSISLLSYDDALSSIEVTESHTFVFDFFSFMK